MKQKLFKLVDSASLGLFRILFGCALFGQTYAYFYWDTISVGYIQTKFRIPYQYFPVPQLFDGNLIYIPFLILLIASVGIILGFRYRLSVCVALISYGYIFFFDQIYYTNHHYLFGLLLFLFLFLDAHNSFSLDAKRLRLPQMVPMWEIGILRFQFVVVYFFAGIAKLNPDWISGKTVSIFGDLLRNHHIFNAVFGTKTAILTLSWGCILLQLGVTWLLLFKSTRYYAIAAYFAFNTINHLILVGTPTGQPPIGVFPLLMIASLVLFFDPDSPRNAIRHIQNWVLHPPKLASNTTPYSPLKKAVILCSISIFVAIQLLLPLRHHLIPGNFLYTQEHRNFNWTMKLYSAFSPTKIRIVDNTTGYSWTERFSDYLSPAQTIKVSASPNAAWILTQHLKEKYQKIGFTDISVFVNMPLEINNHPPFQVINPKTNLSKIDFKLFGHNDWIRSPLTARESKKYQ